MYGIILIFLNTLYLIKRTPSFSKNIFKGCLFIFLTPFILLILITVLLKGCAALVGVR